MAIFNTVYGGEKKVWNWDLSKATSANRTSLSVWNYCYEVQFNNEGNKMFVWHSNSSTGRIYMYSLSTPRDITSTDNNNRIAYGEWSVRGYPNPCFANSWNVLFVWTSDTNYAKYTLWTAYDLSNLNFSSPTANYSMASSLWVQSVSTDGTNIIFRPWTARSLTYTQVNTAWTLQNSQTALLSSSNVMSWCFCNEDKMLMVMDGTTIKNYELWTAGDLSTLNTTPIQSQSTGLSWNPRWIFVDKYGDNIYINIGNVIYRYNLA